jgi:hypothetical protein
MQISRLPKARFSLLQPGDVVIREQFPFVKSTVKSRCDAARFVTLEKMCGTREVMTREEFIKRGYKLLKLGKI